MTYRFLFLALLAFGSGTRASEMAAEVGFRYLTWHVDHRLEADGTDQATYVMAVKVLKERAIEGAKRYSISYSTSVQSAEVMEAYTLKADGHRIDVPRSNFQLEENRGREGGSPLFSDYTTLTVVFPEVAVGDTVGLTYRIVQKEPIFPGHFSDLGSFSRDHAYDDLVIRIDYPASLPVRYASREMAQRTEASNGRAMVEWRYANPKPVHSNRKNYSVYHLEDFPGYTFSTFHSYGELAEAYGVRARPKAKVTERVQKLADEITAGKSEPRAQANALYDWVATNITYGGNCIGIGAVVPHDLDFVLDNRMGDCKDHATLLQTLLAAKGIASTQALVNASNLFRLPEVPVVSTVNHVINYVPSLDLYLDSTAATIPFGLLPLSVSGKPVLWVDGYREGTHTPAQSIGLNRQEMKTVARIGEDGSISGTTEVKLNGLFAAGTRAWMRELPRDREEEFIKRMFQRQGHVGSGTLEKPDAQGLRADYQYKIRFNVERYLQRPGAGAFAIAPLVLSAAPVGGFTAEAVEPQEATDVFCAGGFSSEEYRFELPKGMKLLSVPDDVAVANDFVSYKARYRLKGNVLTVSRIFDDRTRGHVCSPEVISAYRTLAGKALADVRSQVIYK